MKFMNHEDKLIKAEEEILEGFEYSLYVSQMMERYLRRMVITKPAFQENLGKVQKQIEGFKMAIKDKNNFLKFLYDIKNENQNTA